MPTNKEVAERRDAILPFLVQGYTRKEIKEILRPRFGNIDQKTFWRCENFLEDYGDGIVNPIGGKGIIYFLVQDNKPHLVKIGFSHWGIELRLNTGGSMAIEDRSVLGEVIASTQDDNELRKKFKHLKYKPANHKDWHERAPELETTIEQILKLNAIPKTDNSSSLEKYLVYHD